MHCAYELKSLLLSDNSELQCQPSNVHHDSMNTRAHHDMNGDARIMCNWAGYDMSYWLPAELIHPPRHQKRGFARHCLFGVQL